MIQTDAFVLTSEPVGETDRRYSLLTKDFGKIEAVAKAVRKNTAKLAGHLEPVNFAWVGLIESKSGFLLGKQAWQITQALEKESFRALRARSAHPESFRAALAGAAILDEFLTGLLPDDAVFSLWVQFLTGLERHTAAQPLRLNPDFFLAEFVLKLVFALGLFSKPDHCAKCGAQLGKSSAYFRDNHFLCEKCAVSQEDFEKIYPKTLGVLTVLLGAMWFPESSEADRIVALGEQAFKRARALSR